ncbi:MAG: DUF6141 family protein [bacterium]|nr:DUF6141 family protein [bacterium]
MDRESIENIFFHEEQSFAKANRWIGIALFLLPLTMGYFVWEQMIQHRPIGTNPPPDAVLLLLFGVIGIFVPWLILSARLCVEVRDSGVWFRYHPFMFKWKCIGFEDIQSAQAVTYRPILEYGGWGIRIAWGKRAYNVSGNEGVLLTLRSTTTTTLLGSQQAHDLEAAITTAMKTTFHSKSK